MATGGDITLRDLSHPSLNEALKAHNSVTFKLVRTGESPSCKSFNIFRHYRFTRRKRVNLKLNYF